MKTYEEIFVRVIDALSVLAVVAIWIGIFWFSARYLT